MDKLQTLSKTKSKNSLLNCSKIHKHKVRHFQNIPTNVSTNLTTRQSDFHPIKLPKHLPPTHPRTSHCSLKHRRPTLGSPPPSTCSPIRLQNETSTEISSGQQGAAPRGSPSPRAFYCPPPPPRAARTCARAP